MDAEKNALRHRIRASRAARSAGDRAASDAAIAERGIALAERSGVRTLACYLSGSTEPPTRSLIALATARGIRVLLPVVRPGRVLDWAEDDGSERTTRLGVHEPTGARPGRSHPRARVRCRRTGLPPRLGRRLLRPGAVRAGHRDPRIRGAL
jgi:5-formyltetrahydrofolate cyclo-ligase